MTEINNLGWKENEEQKFKSVNNVVSVKVTPFLIDENNGYSPMIGDTIFSGSPITIDAEHHEIHCGDSYLATRAVDLGNGAVDNLLMIVPNEVGNPMKSYHFLLWLGTEAEGELVLTENVSASNLGSSIPVYNRNRNSGNQSGLSFYHTPGLASSSVGTVILTKHFGTGRNVGTDSRAEELVLKNNTQYLIRLINSTTTNNFISWELNHYIHPGI